MILMETKISIDRVTQLVPFFEFPNYKLISSEGLAGGLWLVWKNLSDFQLNTLVTSNRLSSNL